MTVREILNTIDRAKGQIKRGQGESAIRALERLKERLVTSAQEEREQCTTKTAA